MAAVCPQKPTEQEVTVDWSADNGVTLTIPNLSISVTAPTAQEAINALKQKLKEYYKSAS